LFFSDSERICGICFCQGFDYVNIKYLHDAWYRIVSHRMKELQTSNAAVCRCWRRYEGLGSAVRWHWIRILPLSQPQQESNYYFIIVLSETADMPLNCLQRSLTDQLVPRHTARHCEPTLSVANVAIVTIVNVDRQPTSAKRRPSNRHY